MKPIFVITTHQSEKYRPDGHNYTKRAVDSIKEHMKIDHDVIVIDNASNNIYPYEGVIKLYRETQPGGLIRTWNFGVNFGIANGNDHFVLMNDDVYFNESIASYFTVIGNHEYNKVAYYTAFCNNSTTFVDNRGKRQPGVIKDITGSREGPHGFFLSFGKDFFDNQHVNGVMFDEQRPFKGQEQLFHSRIVGNRGKCFVIGDCEIHHSHTGSWRQLYKDGVSLDSKHT